MLPNKHNCRNHEFPADDGNGEEPRTVGMVMEVMGICLLFPALCQPPSLPRSWQVIWIWTVLGVHRSGSGEGRGESRQEGAPAWPAEESVQAGSPA